MRIYSGWPPHQPALSGHEPAEGWLVFIEQSTMRPWPHQLYEDHSVDVHLWVTRLSIAEACLDLLDGLWQGPGTDQGGFAITADWAVMASSRVRTLELYEEAVHLYHKVLTYQFRTLKQPYRASA